MLRLRRAPLILRSAWLTCLASVLFEELAVADDGSCAEGDDDFEACLAAASRAVSASALLQRKSSTRSFAANAEDVEEEDAPADSDARGASKEKGAASEAQGGAVDLVDGVLLEEKEDHTGMAAPEQEAAAMPPSLFQISAEREAPTPLLAAAAPDMQPVCVALALCLLLAFGAVFATYRFRGKAVVTPCDASGRKAAEAVFKAACPPPRPGSTGEKGAQENVPGAATGAGVGPGAALFDAPLSDAFGLTPASAAPEDANVPCNYRSIATMQRDEKLARQGGSASDTGVAPAESSEEDSLSSPAPDTGLAPAESSEEDSSASPR